MFKQTLFCALGFSALALAQEGSLTAGRVELRAFGGINYSADRGSLSPKTPASAGVQAAVGLHRFVAVTGHYAYNDVGHYSAVTCFSGGCSRSNAGGGNIQELMAGIRLTAANPDRVEPYAAFSAGAARFTGAATVAGYSARLSLNRFALAPAGGINFKIARRFGMGFDVRAVHAVRTKWYLQPSLGLFVRI